MAFQSGVGSGRDRRAATLRLLASEGVDVLGRVARSAGSDPGVVRDRLEEHANARHFDAGRAAVARARSLWRAGDGTSRTRNGCIPIIWALRRSPLSSRACAARRARASPSMPAASSRSRSGPARSLRSDHRIDGARVQPRTHAGRDCCRCRKALAASARGRGGDQRAARFECLVERPLRPRASARARP